MQVVGVDVQRHQHAQASLDDLRAEQSIAIKAQKMGVWEIGTESLQAEEACLSDTNIRHTTYYMGDVHP